MWSRPITFVIMVAGVYFIRSGTSEWVKIGHSADVGKRANQIKGMNPDQEVLERVIVTADHEALEKLLHNQVRDRRSRDFNYTHDRKEWFSLTKEEVVYLYELHSGKISDDTRSFDSGEDDQYKVEHIIYHAGHRKSRRFQTIWSDGSITWEPIENFVEHTKNKVLITEALLEYCSHHAELRKDIREIGETRDTKISCWSSESSEESECSDDGQFISQDESSDSGDYTNAESESSEEIEDSECEVEKDSDADAMDLEDWMI